MQNAGIRLVVANGGCCVDRGTETRDDSEMLLMLLRLELLSCIGACTKSPPGCLSKGSLGEC
jgi:hypothetical protein